MPDIKRPFDPFGYRALSGQITQLTSLVEKQGRIIMASATTLTDLQTSVSNLVAAVSNETAAVNAATTAIANELAVITNPDSDDAAVEAAAQSIAGQVTAIQNSTSALSTATASLPPVSQIPNTPAPAPAADAPKNS
jgi:peptidoglycan hydrolase CwlO-like protein